jgi:type III pantothenate kinase
VTLLAIDVGNTQTVAAVYQDGDLLHDWRISTDQTATLDELAAKHDHILQLRGGSLTEVSDLVIASGVPSLTAAYQELATRYLERKALVVGPGVRTGMPLRVDNPHELGADRLANAVAGYRRHGGPCVVVDFGTATTLDVVSATGEYLGGAIAPGLEISLDALAGRAARLFRVSLVGPERAIGKSTAEHMQIGLVLGTAAMVDGLVGRMRRELGASDVAVVATGGLAGLIVRYSEEIEEHDPLLTLDGLRIIHELNVPQAQLR